MTTAAIRDKLQDYIRFADDKKVKAIYTLLEDEISTEYRWFEDKQFVAQMDRELDDFKDGKIKGCTWENVSVKMDKLRTKRYAKK